MGKIRGKSAIESQRKMLNLAKEIIENILKDFPNLQEVYIFGSRARGDYLDTSDIDLMLVFKGIKEMNTIDRMYMVSKYIKGNVDYIVVDEEEKERVKDKKLFWKKGVGFINFL
ncbi:MAG: nucleotidyltransferase domain-containing protein [Saccharolobus sp.]|nr:nucleotidyltransferase domain-containing protein [Saccharolobus sp.]MDT7862486.1 nucleotidyltransferase domain-containing protein [Saccharolobus sp.]